MIATLDAKADEEMVGSSMSPISRPGPPAYLEIPSAHVEIYDQVYHLRGVDPVYITQLAAIVDQKMRAVSRHGGTVDSLRVAVLAALNIADELIRLRQSYNDMAGQLQTSETDLRDRADSLSGVLDEVLRTG